MYSVSESLGDKTKSDTAGFLALALKPHYQVALNVESDKSTPIHRQLSRRGHGHTPIAPEDSLQDIQLTIMDDDLAPSKTEGFKVGEKKTIDEYQKLGRQGSLFICYAKWDQQAQVGVRWT